MSRTSHPDLLTFYISRPFSDKFINVTMNYAKDFKPRLTFIHLTVTPRTTRKIYDKIKILIAYTPVRGKHPNIKRHLLFWTKWVATLPLDDLENAANHPGDAGLKSKATWKPARIVRTSKTLGNSLQSCNDSIMARKFGANI